jgi:hypothetical protein
MMSRSVPLRASDPENRMSDWLLSLLRTCPGKFQEVRAVSSLTSQHSLVMNRIGSVYVVVNKTFEKLREPFYLPWKQSKKISLVSSVVSHAWWATDDIGENTN